MTLRTERLLLRELAEEDLPALRAMLQDPLVMVAYGGPFEEQEVLDWLARQQKRYRLHGHGLWAAVLPESGQLIGQCGLTLQPWKEQEVLEVGYLFARSAWHRGYATEAARACAAQAFRDLGAPLLYAIIRDSNTASRRVAERLGMTPADTWVKRYRGEDMPHVLYRVGREDFLRKADTEAARSPSSL